VIVACCNLLFICLRAADSRSSLLGQVSRSCVLSLDATTRDLLPQLLRCGVGCQERIVALRISVVVA
jgi:hypothetical protein